ncbi:FadR family transcriptional regulator [Staphylococcus condimenti]|uniref:FadR family transcriptional regulator n=1 Tax=Staphylococcus condimenti TaxID=70255 RepID=A0A143PDI1_9STAP|nr:MULTISPECIES: FadR/GntR family transcriptional regulator [Staphylococcus]AMY06597.1 transcriptional regulator [Staphylococcus condimenti]APR60478.1 transcriptional regulator [Staphylococcus condimenti]MDK8645888.1 FadR/GntR family transcriptional regulator [Staphylococcus condimenti]OFP03434.1 transcriptional regulator [Staphylococcus sp. HMSC065E08]PNZ59493.1 FadR family transcriptional regulator [Staphylococcus condimenti]
MKISKTKIYEKIADIILEQIKSGEYAVGDKLPSIQALSKEYGVSVASVREAFNALRTIGVIEIKQGYGTFVTQKEPIFFNLEESSLTRKQVEDLLELREIVELATVKKAAALGTKENLLEMKNALEMMESAVTDGTSGEAADLKFHLAIAKAAHNSMLFDLMNNISDVIQETMKETRKMYLFNKQRTLKRLYDEHLKIYEAIQKKDAEAAEYNMRNHLEEVQDTILQNMKSK